MSRFWPLHVALAATCPFVNHFSVVYGLPAVGLLWLGMLLAGGVLVGTRSLVVFIPGSALSWGGVDPKSL